MKIQIIYLRLIIFLVILSLSINEIVAQVSSSFILQQNNIVFNQNGIYDDIYVENCNFTEEVGSPKIPVFTETFVLPYDAVVTDIQVTTTSSQKIQGNFYVIPAQYPRALDGSDPPAFVEPDLSVYSSNLPYPNKTVEIVDDGYMHGYHVVTVKVCPISYIPASGEIYLQNYNFTINYTISNRTNSVQQQQSLRRSELTKNFIKNIVKNANDVENCKNNNVQVIYNNGIQFCNDTVNTKGGTTSAIDTLVPDYIIITNDELKPVFQQLAYWKIKKGVPTIIKTIEEIEPDYYGSDLQEKIRNYLKDMHSKYGGGLFVLLGGDVNVIPPRLNRFSSYSNGQEVVHIHPTDLYYATIEGTWNYNNNDTFGEFGDIVDVNYAFILGRASIKNTEEAQVFVSKIISYEKNTNTPINNYVNNFLYLIGFLDINNDTLYNSYANRLQCLATQHLSSYTNYFILENIVVR